jgi:hypothetical protein
MARGFRGRFHPRHVRSIHNANSSDDRENQTQRQQHSSQSSGAQQSSFRPPAPRGRGGRSFGGRYGDQPRKLFCLFCSEDKGHTTRTCQVTIQKHKEIAEGEVGPAYRFVLFSLYSGICRQSIAHGLCRFGKPFSNFLGPVASTTTTASTCHASRSTARRASPRSTTARPSGGVQSSHSQQHCA